MNRTAINRIAVECYTSGDIIKGSIECPPDLRLTDVFNNPNFLFRGEFLQLYPPLTEREDPSSPNPSLYVRKSAVQLIAVLEPDARRGVGAANPPRRYPFVSKYPRNVSLRVGHLQIKGEVHCLAGQTVESLLNDGSRFLPVTDVLFGDKCEESLSRPFVAVNREQVMWVSCEPMAPGPDPKD